MAKQFTISVMADQVDGIDQRQIGYDYARFLQDFAVGCLGQSFARLLFAPWDRPQPFIRLFAAPNEENFVVVSEHDDTNANLG